MDTRNGPHGDFIAEVIQVKSAISRLDLIIPSSESTDARAEQIVRIDPPFDLEKPLRR